MAIANAKKNYWRDGLPVLLKELELFEHEKTNVISIGNSQVEFLRRNEIHPYKILLHFPSQNGHWRKGLMGVNKFVDIYSALIKTIFASK